MLTTQLHLIFAILLIDLCLLVEKLYTVFDGGMPEDMLLGFLPLGPQQVEQLEVFCYYIIPPVLLTPICMLATNRGWHEELLG